MYKKNILAFLLFLSALCMGYANPQPDQGLVFIGVAGPQGSRKKSIEKALEDAARKVAFYHSVGGRIVDTEESTVGLWNESRLYYSDDYNKYIKNLRFNPDTDVVEEDGVFFVHTVYTGAETLRIGYVKPSKTIKPRWIDNPPKDIGGYRCAAGFAGRQSTYAKTIIKSYENAVYSLLQNNMISVKTRQIDDGGTFGFSSSYSSWGTIHGFYVFDFWMDPKTKAVWTLALAESITTDTITREGMDG